jgi:multidrug resistance protein MdtO
VNSIASSPRLSFFGLQLGAVYFVINMQKFARETSLSVARDRVAGVFLGLLLMWLIFDQLWSAPASVEMKRVFISTLRLLAQFAREPVSADIRSAIRRTSALHDTINTIFDNVRSLADGVLLEFGPTRRHDLALRDRIRRWQPQLRALFIMRVHRSSTVSNYQASYSRRPWSFPFRRMMSIPLRCLRMWRI